jgi:predicted amidophosphoribosyltransferase
VVDHRQREPTVAARAKAIVCISLVARTEVRREWNQEDLLAEPAARLALRTRSLRLRRECGHHHHDQRHEEVHESPRDFAAEIARAMTKRRRTRHDN